jgi:hypothetical protein
VIRIPIEPSAPCIIIYISFQEKLLPSSLWIFRTACLFKGPAVKMVENMNTNFMSTYRFWAGNSIASSILLVKLAPAYSIGGSYTWTAVPLFLLQWLAFAIYSIILYPRYFSPLRHLPGPPVGVSLRGKETSAETLTRGGPSLWANSQSSQPIRLACRCEDGSTKSLTMVLFATRKVAHQKAITSDC